MRKFSYVIRKDETINTDAYTLILRIFFFAFNFVVTKVCCCSIGKNKSKSVSGDSLYKIRKTMLKVK
jgi:hypothetical protein